MAIIVAIVDNQTLQLNIIIVLLVINNLTLERVNTLLVRRRAILVTTLPLVHTGMCVIKRADENVTYAGFLIARIDTRARAPACGAKPAETARS